MAENVQDHVATSGPAEILVMGRLPVLENAPDGRLVFRRLWTARDPDAFLAEHSAAIRGVVTFGALAVDEALLQKLPNVEIVCAFGVGYDQIDMATAKRRGITVTYAADVLTEEVADMALGLLIATLRHIPQADRFVRAGKWREGNYPLSDASLRGRSVGIVGLGRIGKAIARRLQASKIAVAYHGRTRQADVDVPHHASLLTLAQAVDTLIVATPGGAGTHHLIDAAVLKALGPKGVLINISRGSVVDETALIAALADHTILTAGLDVFEDEPNVAQALLDNDDIVVLPHIASASAVTRAAMGQLVIENLESWFAGNGPLTPVPETPWPRETQR
ncbi:MAG TPA: 2-hydroxyacid dehydrogenase [Caulobacteraceae bacterium]|jgi:lactate dehydrogenase-like 2-hydroxyacid dehydrogenase|nr:2-hydroxyacid dehydrogenase [Caulobacteraceae bacterium]